MRVKICGITNYEDAKISVDYGADALGFVTYEKSPRFINPQEIKEIIKKLPPFVVKVVLFVNKTPDEIDKIMSYTNADIAQIHFDVDDEFYKKLNSKYLKVIRAKSPEDIKRDNYAIVDAFVKEYGGSGKRVNLEWFKNQDNSKLILAGGLNPENVAEVKGYGFYGVDVSSGVEEKKGKKDKMKLKKFIEIVKNL